MDQTMDQNGGTAGAGPSRDRRILHLDMDCFFVSVERRRDPSLVGRPVVVGADPRGGSGRGVVCAASYEARRFGIHSAMPIQQAYRRCPGAVYLRPSGGVYGEASREVGAFLAERVPDLVQASIDEFYGDLTGCERLFGDLFEYARSLKAAIGERFGLPSTVGVASSRLVAKVAAGQAKPDGAAWVPPGADEAAAFLAPLPIRRLPGIGPETAGELERFGVRTVGDVARLGPAWLGERFGWWGRVLAERALGRQESTSGRGPDLLARSIGHEETFETDSEDPEWILARLFRLVEEACARLRRARRRARTLVLRLRYADFMTRQRSRTIPPTDLDTEVFGHLESLFEAEYTRRVRVRLIGVRLTNLLAPGLQYLDFDDPDDHLRRALAAADRARDRHGRGAVHLARALEPETRLPVLGFERPPAPGP